MDTEKIIEWIDIQAPRQDVFAIVMDLERRLQLSPLYGTTLLEEVSQDYPNQGSKYRLKLREQQDAEKDLAYDTIVTDIVPLCKFAYNLTARRQPQVTWLFQEVSQGTRIIYEEQFLADAKEEQEFMQSVREVVRQWLRNIKFYAELRDGRGQRFLKWIMDRYFLRLRNDQRKVVLMILLLHAVSIFSFIMAAIILGLSRVF